MSIKGKINYALYKILSKKKYLEASYRWYHKGKLHLKNPQKFTEKLYCLKLYNKEHYFQLINQCYDKFKARSYVENIIGKQYLTNIYGVWDNADDICFDNLPEQCIFKITQSSGFNKICLQGYKQKEKEIKQQLQNWLDLQNNKKYTEKIYKVENYYFDQNARIMCEELLELNNSSIPEDIRIYCFDGKAEFITIDYDSVSSSGEKLSEYNRNVYDLNGKFLPYEFGRTFNKNYQFPDIPNLNEMINVAEKLAEPFAFVRVDLYNIDGRIVFGELTWIPQGGSGRIFPESFDLYLGEKIKVNVGR